MLNNNNNHKEYTPLLKEFQHNEKVIIKKYIFNIIKQKKKKDKFF